MQLGIQFCRCGPLFLINLFRKSWFSGSEPSGPYLVVHLLACRASEENWELSLWTHLFHDTDHDTDHYFTDLRNLRNELNDLLRISMISWRNLWCPPGGHYFPHGIRSFPSGRFTISTIFVDCCDKCIYLFIASWKFNLANVDNFFW